MSLQSLGPLLRKVQGHELALELAGGTDLNGRPLRPEAEYPFARWKSMAALVMVARVMGPIGSVLPVLSSSQDGPQHNPRCRAPDPSGLPPKPVTGGSAGGLPRAQAYATRAGIVFTAACLPCGLPMTRTFTARLRPRQRALNHLPDNPRSRRCHA